MQADRKKRLLFVLIIIATYFVACAPQKSYNVLSFLFDGVPAPGLLEANISNDSVYVGDSMNILALSNRVPQQLMVLHSPYREKQCALCHDQSSSSKTIEPQPQLCYICHDNFNENFNVVHGPAGGGFCTSCHNPHKSKSKKLLLRPTQELCIHCHDSILVFNNKYHQNVELGNCMECHNPHGGENRYMMQQGACYQCHDDFKKEYSFLHGPVAGEYCSTCHSPHITETENLLLRKGTQLCLDCHNEALISENENHKNKDVDCTECHNPHGGENRFFTKMN